MAKAIKRPLIFKLKKPRIKVNIGNEKENIN